MLVIKLKAGESVYFSVRDNTARTNGNPKLLRLVIAESDV